MPAHHGKKRRRKKRGKVFFWSRAHEETWARRKRSRAPTRSVSDSDSEPPSVATLAQTYVDMKFLHVEVPSTLELEDRVMALLTPSDQAVFGEKMAAAWVNARHPHE